MVKINKNKITPPPPPPLPMQPAIRNTESRINDPIILYPKTTPKEIWKSCDEHVKKGGGLTYENGEPNWRAAFGADPGVCSCPNCHETHWKYGIIHQCPKCRFIYPTDWWSMYSYGVQSALRGKYSKIDDWRRDHPYWQYGFEHPTEKAIEDRQKIDWKAAVGDCYKYCGNSKCRDFQNPNCAGVCSI